MIIKINQIEANFAIKFEVIIDDKLSYTGSQSRISSMLYNELIDLEGIIILESSLMPLTESKNKIPFKWAWSEKRTNNHTVLNKNEKPVAFFYKSAGGSLKYNIDFGDYELILYPIDKGRKQFTPIFHKNRQIGQINKDNFIEGHKDWYRLYLIDECSDLAPVLSLFVIYYDSYDYNYDSGKVVGYSSEINYTWRYSKYKNMYDPNWLPRHFTLVDDSKMLEKMSKKSRRYTILTLGFILGGWLLFGIIYLFFLA